MLLLNTHSNNQNFLKKELENMLVNTILEKINKKIEVVVGR